MDDESWVVEPLLLNSATHACRAIICPSKLPIEYRDNNMQLKSCLSTGDMFAVPSDSILSGDRGYMRYEYHGSESPTTLYSRRKDKQSHQVYNSLFNEATLISKF